MSLPWEKIRFRFGGIRAGCDFLARKERAFSLVEMLVVMAIVSVLFVLSWSGFYGLRTTMVLHQSAENLRADIINTQRSAMLLTRGQEDAWIKGMGIDLTKMVDGDSTVSYDLFKWCSESYSYEELDPGESLATEYDDNVCAGNVLHTVSGKGDVTVSSGELKFCVHHDGGGDQPVRYIVFESVSGMVHFYNPNGQPMSSVTKADLTLQRGTRHVTVNVYQNGEIVLDREGESEGCP